MPTSQASVLETTVDLTATANPLVDPTAATDLLQPLYPSAADLSFQQAEATLAPFWSTDDEGVFTVDKDGWVYVDFLLDGGKHAGQLGLFSLTGMENLNHAAFVAEATRRVTSDDTRLGGIVIDDRQQGARYGGDFGDYENQDWDRGEYDELTRMYLGAGTQFALMMMPNSTFAKGKQTPLFSMAAANPYKDTHLADVTGEGIVFGFEDLRADQRWADQDYNDLVFAVGGITGTVAAYEEVANVDADWRDIDAMEVVADYRFNPIEYFPTDPLNGTKYSPGETHIIIDPEKTTIDVLNTELEDLGFEPLNVINLDLAIIDNFWVLQFEQDLDLLPVRDALSAIEGVQSAGFDELIVGDAPRSKEDIEDSEYASDSENFWGLNAIDAADAWEYQAGSNDVVVAVLDTGIDYNHPDLRDNIWHSIDSEDGAYYGISVKRNTEGKPEADRNTLKLISEDNIGQGSNNNHGNLNAGIIGAVGFNDEGVIGVSPEVTLFPVRVLESSDGGTPIGSTVDVLTALDHIQKPGNKELYDVDIFNLSFSLATDSVGTQPSLSPSMSQIKALMEQANDDIFVTSAGQQSDSNGHKGKGKDIDNPENGLFYPSHFNLSNLITVTATAGGYIDGALKEIFPSFINYGTNSVHVAAPGAPVRSTVSPDGGYVPGTEDKWYETVTKSATSYAASFVSGLFASLKTENRELIPEDAISALMDNGDFVAGLEDKTISGSRVNARESLFAINVPPEATNLDTPQTYTEDIPLDLADIAITDLDSYVENITLQLSNPAAGSLSVPTAGGITPVFDVSNGTWSAFGNLDDINTILEQVQFIPAQDFNEDLSIEVTIEDIISDEISGTSLGGTINLTGVPVNDAPRDIRFLNQEPITENDFGAVIGTLSADDVEGDNITFSVDDSRFEVVDNQLKLKDDQSIDFESESQISLNITATDDGVPNESLTQAFVINVLDNTGRPDLTGSYFDVQEPRNAGESFDVEFRLQNIADGDAGAFNVGFYISKDRFISTDDYKLGSYRVVSLTDNSTSRTLTKQLTLPRKWNPFWQEKKDSTYYVGMIADVDNDVLETNGSNNRNTGFLDDYDDVPIINTYSGRTKVTINRAKGDLDGWLNDSDFYSRVAIGKEELDKDFEEWPRSLNIGGENDISPDWVFEKFVTTRNIPIAIQLWDSDGFLTGKDDRADIDPKEDGRDVNIWYDLWTGEISGEVFGYQENELYSKGGNAEIWFTVSQG